MRKIALLLLIIVIFLSSGRAVYSQELTGEDASPTATLTPVPQEYTLPYPGILPDSPFYFLKVTRDRVVSFLIADPLKKAEFNLLQADKRLVAGQYLIEKKNFTLAESTLSKGLNYFEESLIVLKDAQKAGRDIKPLHERLTLSIDKHNQLYESFSGSGSADFKKQMDLLSKRLATYTKEVAALAPK